MRIGSLRKRADALSEDAWQHRRMLREHARRSFAIFRRRLGTTGGIAICFSLGFLVGLRQSEKKKRAHRADGRAPPRRKAASGRLAAGRLGESLAGSIVKLVSGLIAGVVMKLLEAQKTAAAAPADEPAAQQN